jgi:hypothetical protein
MESMEEDAIAALHMMGQLQRKVDGVGAVGGSGHMPPPPPGSKVKQDVLEADAAKVGDEWGEEGDDDDHHDDDHEEEENGLMVMITARPVRP